VNMTTIRRWHSYAGLFMAPSVLFFALTGIVQLFNFHEAHGSYVAPAILEKLSSVHKDQVFRLSDHHEPVQSEVGSPVAGASAAAPDATEDDDKPQFSTWALKVFFLLVSVCLIFSTSLGLWMGLAQTRLKRTGWILVLAGALIPLGLLLF
jgi:hypothetical protein